MSIFDKAKEKAEELVEKVKDKLDRDETGSASNDDPGTAATTGDQPTIPNESAVTPADVAQSIADPDLPHPDIGDQASSG